MLAHADAAIAIAPTFLLVFVAQGTDCRLHLLSTIERSPQPAQDTNKTETA
jgi:hypothetical protein